jgi:hypothetical protein
MSHALALITRSANRLWLILGGLALAAVVVVWLAPAEQTLGGGIRWVYVHVALTWTGMTALVVAGLLGAALAWTGRPPLQAWTVATGAVGLGFYVAGLAVSLGAAIVNWGGVFWDEPRTQTNLQVLAVGVIVVVAAWWWPNARGRGLLFALLAAWMVWSLAITPLVLHPRNPIMTSSSAAIQSTFLTLYGLGSLAAAALIVHFHSRAAPSN